MIIPYFKGMKDDYKKIIKDLESAIEIDGSFIVSRDGILMYSDASFVHAESFAAMCATLLSSAEVAMDEIGSGLPDIVEVEGKNKKIIVSGAGKDMLIAIITSKDSKNIYEEIRNAARKISLLSEKK